MEVFRNAWHEGELISGGVVAIGNFDGLHLGQRALLERVAERGRELGVPSIAVTFDPHPLKILDPARAPERLTTNAQREELLASCGLQVLCEIFFTPEFSRVPSRRFVREFLLDRLAIREVYVGTGFVFGHDRDGDMSLLHSMGRDFGFRAVGVDEVTYEGRAISSTRIRAALRSGDPEGAAAMLGRAYALTGIVVRGAQRGRTLGFPTINLACEQELLPRGGVYVSRTTLDEEALRSVANVGTRPTVEEDGQKVVEAHILDFDRDVYGMRASVEVLHRLRDERRFESLDALQAQIQRDAEAAREYEAVRVC